MTGQPPLRGQPLLRLPCWLCKRALTPDPEPPPNPNPTPNPDPDPSPTSHPSSYTWRSEIEDLTGQAPLERYGMTELGMALSNPLAPAERLPGYVISEKLASFP